MDRKKMHKSKGKWVTISTSLVASLMVGASAQTIASAQEDASIYTYTEDESIAENQEFVSEETYVEPVAEATPEAEWVEYSAEAPAEMDEVVTEEPGSFEIPVTEEIVEEPVELEKAAEPVLEIELPANPESIEEVVHPEVIVDADELVEAVVPEAEAPVEETAEEVVPEAEAPVEEIAEEAVPETEAPVEETAEEVEAPAETQTPQATEETTDPKKETPVNSSNPATPTQEPTVAPVAKPVVETQPVQAEPKVEAKTQSVPTANPVHTISQGDTLWSLARKNNVSVSQLKEWNNLSNDSIIASASLIVANPTSNAVTSNDQKRQTETATKPASNSSSASQQSSAYTISAGDTLYSIARRNNVSVADLREWNNLTSDTIYTNSNLVVKNTTKPTTSTKPDDTPSYSVSSGDTLWSIARRNNVSVAQLQEWNNLSSSSIFANQNLVVSRHNNADQPSSGGNTTAPTETTTKTHTVNRGEYLYSIARQHGVTVNQLREWNKLSGDNVHPNDRLVVSKPGTATGGSTEAIKPEEKPEKEESPAADNANKQAVIDWFQEREGKVTYSMTNRMGPDSYDCSSAVFFALMEAGYLPDGTWPGTTESLYALEGSLFSPISRDEVQAGDIFVAGHKGFSLGSGGHTGVAVSNNNIIHSNYSDNGISTTPIEGYTSYAGMPTYWYRLMEN